jgi:hypothetical protein
MDLGLPSAKFGSETGRSHEGVLTLSWLEGPDQVGPNPSIYIPTGHHSSVNVVGI